MIQYELGVIANEKGKLGLYQEAMEISEKSLGNNK
jgi:hypothetical protein